jgi:NTP pyrophosphatase (non-canonical NTP hydrolase)
MTLNEYQEIAAIFNVVSDEKKQTHAICGLVEEVGELCGKLKRKARGDFDSIDGEIQHIRDLKQEIGDVAWYLADVCSAWGFSLEEVCIANIEKLEDRRVRGKIQGSGDQR